MRKVDEANTEEKRKLILQAALKCFVRNGLQRTSINDICKESGMRSGHLYYYFSGKDAIVEATFQLGIDEVVCSIENMLDNRDISSAIINIHDIAESERQEWGISPGLRLEFTAETARNDRLRAIQDHHLDRMMGAIQKAATKAVADGQLDPRFDVVDFSNAVRLIWTGLSGVRVEGNFDLTAYARAIETLLKPWLLKPAHP